MKKALSILLVLFLTAGLIALAPVTASAANAATPMVAAGFAYSIALKSDGMVWAWGSNSYGQLGGGDYAAGDTVNISAGAPPEGQVFDKWVATGVTLDSPNDADTSFTMPGNAVALTASFKDIPDDGPDLTWLWWTLGIVGGLGILGVIAAAVIGTAVVVLAAVGGLAWWYFS